MYDQCWPKEGQRTDTDGPFLAQFSQGGSVHSAGQPSRVACLAGLWGSMGHGLFVSKQPRRDNETISSPLRCHHLDTEGIDGLVTMGT